MGTPWSTLPSKARAFWIFFACALAMVVLERLLKYAVPEGQEGSTAVRVLQWARDMLSGIPTDWLLVAAGTALLLHAWDERRRLLASAQILMGRRPEAQQAAALELDFENKLPWVTVFKNANVPLKGGFKRDGSVIVAPRKCRWFCLGVYNAAPHAVARDVRVMVTTIEYKILDGFADTGFHGPLMLRWADSGEDYRPRDIHHATPCRVDFISLDEEWNKVFVKWEPPTHLANSGIFREIGVYRITVVAVADNGAPAKLRLRLDWSGDWAGARIWVHEEDRLAA